MMIAHEQSKLVVGKVYSVAHVVIERLNGKLHSIPVNPFKHKDPQFGADFYHYHIDGRFAMDAWSRDNFKIKNGITNTAVHCNWDSYKVKEIIYLDKRCVRLTTGVNPPLTDREYDFNAKLKYGVFPTKKSLLNIPSGTSQ